MKKNTHIEKRYISILLLFTVAMLPGGQMNTLSAQPQATRTSDLLNFNPWLAGSNPAGLIFNPKLQLSVAEVAYNRTNGDFRQATTAPSIDRYQVNSASYRALGKVQLYGHIGYFNESQHHRQWSAMLQPQAHLLNFGDSVPGRQQNETYAICGSIAIPLNSSWTVGGSIDYKARSGKKKSDPRNANDQTELLCSPGLIFTSGVYRFGANFIYQRINEEVSYLAYDDINLHAQTYYPLWYSLPSSSNNNKRNYRDERLGGALQLYISDQKKQWFNEFSYTHGIEKADLSDPNGWLAGETERREFSYTGDIRLHTAFRHSWQPGYHRLNRTGFDYLQASADNSTSQNPENYGRVKRSAIIDEEVSFIYTLARPESDLANRWAAHIRGSYQHTETVFLIYPARFVQPITRWSTAIGYERRMTFRKQVLEVGGQLAYSTGHGHLPEGKSENDAPLPEVQLVQNTKLLYQDFQVQTAESLTASLRLQYTHSLTASCAFFSTAALRYTRALSSGYKGVSQQEFHLAAGILFSTSHTTVRAVRHTAVP